MYQYKSLRIVIFCLLLCIFTNLESAISSGTQVEVLFSPAGIFLKSYSAVGLEKSSLPNAWQVLLQNAEITYVKQEGSRIYAIWLNKNSKFREYNHAKWFDKDDLSGKLLLVNAKNPLPGDWVSKDLISIDRSLSNSRIFESPNITLQKDAWQALEQVATEAAMSGDPIVLNSAYRSGEYQRTLFNQEVINSGDSAAVVARRVAVPGTSEHQTGLAVDLNANDWLVENCWRFGFILRYPEDKTDLTGIIPEPWHYRYIGLPHSLIMQEQGLCLEEYLATLKTVSIWRYRGNVGKYDIYYIGDWASKVGLTDDNTQIEVTNDGSGGYVVTTTLIENLHF